MKPTTQDYCEFLISTQVNFTQTYFADHHRSFSHDAINRFLVNANISPVDVWKFAQESIVFDNNGCLIFDDSVLLRPQLNFVYTFKSIGLTQKTVS